MSVGGQERLNPASDHRSDFIRRLFAIAVSVGFAGALANAAWVEAGRLPAADELPRLACLIAGMILVIGSWESYHRHIEKTDRSILVFYLDVVIVFSYLLMLLLSLSPNVFLWLVGIIFGLYVVWDILVLVRFGETVSHRRALISALWCACFLLLSFLNATVARPEYWAAFSVLLAAICFRWRWFRTVPRTGFAVIVAWLPHVSPLIAGS